VKRDRSFGEEKKKGEAIGKEEKSCYFKKGKGKRRENSKRGVLFPISP